MTTLDPRLSATAQARLHDPTCLVWVHDDGRYVLERGNDRAPITLGQSEREATLGLTVLARAGA